MKLAALFFCAGLYAVSVLPAAGKEWLYDYEIVAHHPHDSRNFTQGLCYEDGILYEGTGQRGESALISRTLDGRVIRRENLAPHYFGEGITVFDEHIYQLTWTSGTALVWDQATMTRIGSRHYATQGWGLTGDGENLIMSDGSATLYFRRPDTFDIIKTVQVQSESGPVRLLNELEYIENLVWANVWKSNRIVMIHPETGRVHGWLDLSKLAAPYAKAGTGRVLNGIAYDAANKFIFVTGKYWPKLFVLRVTRKDDES